MKLYLFDRLWSDLTAAKDAQDGIRDLIETKSGMYQHYQRLVDRKPNFE